MIRFLRYYRLKLGWKKIFEDIANELTLFQDYESLTRGFFHNQPERKVLIVGHTHEPVYREYRDGTTFVNTGSHDMNFTPLTYAKISIVKKDYDLEDFSNSVKIVLNKWVPKSDLPYEEFR
jgi:predicted phosphodiesterase